jgi:choline monooxygenase
MFDIDPDIRRASTLPAEFYRDRRLFDACKERVFAPSWQFVGHARELDAAGAVRPFELSPGYLGEPLVLTRDSSGRLHCLSNVCSHRGNLVQLEAGHCRKLRCGYHGRRFGLDGRFEHMPGFEGALNFPSPAEDLRSVALESFGGLLFVSLQPRIGFDELIDQTRGVTDERQLDEFVFDPTRSREYFVEAHWALYMDNYLEGFHVPFVHPGLTRSLDYDAYSTELAAWSSVQIGVAKAGEPVFPGSDVAAYYAWLFPNTMLNFYPWGLSVNVVQPLGLERTRVLYRTYVREPHLLDQGAGGALDEVEREDQLVVEQVQRGVRSRHYRRGRYSPTREQAVHHFHRLLERELGRTDSTPPLSRTSCE